LIWGILYLGGLYPFVILLGTTAWLPYVDAFSGGDCLLFLFALLWVGDTAAMWVGSALGKHRLAPAVSPNKTIEGFIGGLLGAAVIGIVMALWKFSGLPWYHVLGIAIGCSLFGQLGDLVESMWKRSLGIKDSSTLIPGHGGVLDRFDSLLFAAPFMYFYLKNLVTILP
jgi:phosphatidate cytidylyltransferase